MYVSLIVIIVISISISALVLVVALLLVVVLLYKNLEVLHVFLERQESLQHTVFSCFNVEIRIRNMLQALIWIAARAQGRREGWGGCIRWSSSSRFCRCF